MIKSTVDFWVKTSIMVYINYRSNIMDTSKHNIKRVYSGKPGCMCGCRGKYTESGAQVTKVYNMVMNHPDVKFSEVGKCAYLEPVGNRNYVVYFKD